MIIQEMFKKEINRNIRGVIKADQTNEADIYQELDEYVVTRELHKHFSKFYENYLKGVNGKTDNVGVWISGFFGSGKSHFLKILSYLLKNDPVKGVNPIDFFEDKISDPLVYANMKRTAEVPTETILFNIDSKSPLDNKSKEDAILRVLLKVFYEHRGYYGDNPVVAELEKYLDDEGNLETFKTEYEKVAGEPWLNRRNSFYFDTHYVKTALLEATDMTEEAVDRWLNYGIDNIEVSIEKFAHDVKEYIDTKGEDFHLVFLIDEIGQYIGDRRDLMLNLQTVTENLGAICQGRAWVMVTSQDSIDSVVKVKGDDFSRIQGRFDTRLSLSSVSVDEVIQKRILEKKEHADESLKAMYPDKGPILKNVISFRESTADFSGFDNAQEFSDVYPFIPYQYRLLQNVFEQVRKHGSSGKHLSEGERSMLSAYREAGIRFMNEDRGTIIPFYAFYDTIKEFLQPSVYRVIERAASNTELNDDSFNIDLLKVLFLIKYVKELPANIDNIATLMVTHIDEDKLELKEKVQASLKKLMSQTLIQKNGDVYDFLTDDEQDINREIKEVRIDEEIVKRELADYIFKDLYNVNKYSYSKMYNFPFNQTMDEKHYGNQTSSIGVNILSPLSEIYHEADQALMAITSGSNEIIMKLGGDESYVEEMEEALKIEEYRRKKNPTQQPENVQNILNSKQSEVRERRRRVRSFLEEAIKNGTFFMNGNQLDIKGSSVSEKMNEAFRLLVENIYTDLSLIQDFTQSDSDLKTALVADNEQVTLDGEGLNKANEQAKNKVDEFIRLESEMNKQIRIKPLYDRFSDVPYGWRELDIATIIAELLKDQRIRIQYNAEYLEPQPDARTLMTVFTRPKEADKAIVVVRQQVDERLIRSVKGIVRELFDKRDLPDDEDGLIKDIRGLIKAKEEEIGSYKPHYNVQAYPGKSILGKGLEHFSQFNRKIDNLTFFKRFEEMEDDLYDWFEDVQYVKSFFATEQRNIFDKGLQALEKYEENENYVQTEEVTTAMDELKIILNNPIPYGQIKEIPGLVHTLDEEMGCVLEQQKEVAQKEIEEDFKETRLKANQDGVSEQTRERIQKEFDRKLQSLESYNNIYKVDASIAQSEQDKNRFNQIIQEEIATYREAQKNDEQEDKPGQETSIPVKEVSLLELSSTNTLKTEKDVDDYVDLLERKLKEIIHSNQTIEFKE